MEPYMLFGLLFAVVGLGVAWLGHDQYRLSEAAYIVDSPDWDEKDAVLWRRVRAIGFGVMNCSIVTVALIYLLTKTA